MTTSEQQGNPPLTRKQLRELRETGAIPVHPARGEFAAVTETPVPAEAPVEAEQAAAFVVPDQPVVVENVDETDALKTTLSRRELRKLQNRRATTAEVRVEAPVEPGEAAEPITEEQLSEATSALQEEPVEPVRAADLAAAIDTTGSQHAAPSALIFDQTPGPLTLATPLSSDGGVMITGSFELPDGLGSRGHAEGVTDGKEVDAVLLDRELAANSSPAPVAASSAIGTIKPAGEVMRQPAPEKGNKLLMGLAITAGALMVALTAALILAFTNNVF